MISACIYQKILKQRTLSRSWMSNRCSMYAPKWDDDFQRRIYAMDVVMIATRAFVWAYELPVW